MIEATSLSKGAETYVYEVCENIIYPQEYFDDLGENPIEAMQRGHDLRAITLDSLTRWKKDA